MGSSKIERLSSISSTINNKQSLSLAISPNSSRSNYTIEAVEQRTIRYKSFYIHIYIEYVSVSISFSLFSFSINVWHKLVHVVAIATTCVVVCKCWLVFHHMHNSWRGCTAMSLRSVLYGEVEYVSSNKLNVCSRCWCKCNIREAFRNWLWSVIYRAWVMFYIILLLGIYIYIRLYVCKRDSLLQRVFKYKHDIVAIRNYYNPSF